MSTENKKLHSCGYPLWHTFRLPDSGSEIEYDVYLWEKVNKNLIYSGKVFPYSSIGSTFSIDISEICREYMDTFYENIFRSGDYLYFDEMKLNDDGTRGSVVKFVVVSEHNYDENGNDNDETISEMEYTVIYNYNTDYMDTCSWSGNLNDPVSMFVDPRQRIPWCGYKLDSGTEEFSCKIGNEALPVMTAGPVAPGGKHQYFTMMVDLPQVKLMSGIDLFAGTKISMYQTSMGGENPKEFILVPECHNRFVLYYVNKYGGLDALLCSGKSVESFKSSNTDVRLYKDRLNRQEWEKKRIHSEITKQYKLHTGLLDDAGAKKIDHLIYSPKVWIHDLSIRDADGNYNAITACLITDTGVSVKNFRNDRTLTYEINVEESQSYIRR